MQVITEEIDIDIIEENVKLLDLMYRTNELKPKDQQISNKEFHNDSINTAVDLKPQFAEWAMQTKI